MTEPCDGCPFEAASDDELAERRDYVDRGGWIPCKFTEAGPREECRTLERHIDRLRQEVECVGARRWRRRNFQ